MHPGPGIATHALVARTIVAVEANPGGTWAEYAEDTGASPGRMREALGRARKLGLLRSAPIPKRCRKRGPPALAWFPA
jgi:hypothetical protein